MIKAVMPAVIAVSLALPMQAAMAQPAPAAPAASDNIIVIRPAHIVAIGAGVLGGIVVGEAILATDLGVIVGGVLGGYLAHVWYGGRQIEVNVGSAPKS